MTPRSTNRTSESIRHQIGPYFKSLDAIKAAINELVKIPELAYYVHGNPSDPLNGEIPDGDKVRAWLQSFLGYQNYLKCQQDLLLILREKAFFECSHPHSDWPNTHWLKVQYNVVSAAVWDHGEGRKEEEKRAGIIFKWIISHLRMGDWGQEALQYFKEKIAASRFPIDFRMIKMVAKLMPGCTLEGEDPGALMALGPHPRFHPSFVSRPPPPEQHRNITHG